MKVGVRVRVRASPNPIGLCLALALALGPYPWPHHCSNARLNEVAILVVERGAPTYSWGLGLGLGWRVRESRVDMSRETYDPKP